MTGVKRIRSLRQGEVIAAEARWREAYDPHVIERLSPFERYTIIRVSSEQFAYTSYDRLVEALKAAWDAGFVPQIGPRVRGVDLPEEAPDLEGVDTDLRCIDWSRLEGHRPRFPRRR